MQDIFRKFRDVGIIPVIVMEHEDQAEKLADVLCDNGLPCAEVTFRTNAAAKVIAAMVKHRPEMLVGAGTVLTIEEVDAAIEAGAKFIVSPGLNPTIVKYCQSKKIPVAPGTQTPSEMEQAISLGLDFVKFFPAEQSGGLNMLRAVVAPYGQLSFMPTGGINANNVRQYLADDKIVACGGSWMVKQAMMDAGNWKGIAKLVKEAASIVREVRGESKLVNHLLAS
ncbi:MAG: bifunctional 4-hydroxy-2-oxoglutarate aldolase/2-dehydro-3-deoxy-phosphogluconate aldolase [Selenomonas sp.]|uniref:bifunctional 4-hydroxy-2-oxoglutarate aldolase/2-dehydro-3-deoxy-phosphogluconate aldolase n=1 Tax=Selenomonas sp. TaxID=2053611 RepID=UPI0025D22945|nr:bifunctional 4-hydroxy-2-oxoglutarate aldolase/2-dehydro-3-deoxy-phosphogluconate aldolase [Selenomonas sp.]MCR5758481.1 bifunctional 4-hydroxy-2-oxoglutarate aldolase/2-dehydro-3-deoxy-phosphogluconate aldolase [Selenomonas sp.]